MNHSKNPVNDQWQTEKDSQQKYFLGKLQERNGEYEYTHNILFEMPDASSCEDWLDHYASEFYGEEAEEMEEGWYFHGGTIFVCVEFLQELTAVEYAVMKKYNI